jgi:TP901 family phage tail tape measure protein
MLNSLGLGFLFTATDMASGVMGKLEGNLKSLEKVSGTTITGMEAGMNRFLVGMTGVAASAVGIMGAFKLADAAGEFEQSVAAAGAVSKASAAEMDLMKKAALGMATDLGSTPVQAMNALQELAAAGYSAQESIDLLRPTLELAAGSLGKLSPEEAAGLASQALKAFGIDAKLAGVAVDQMLSAVNTFALSASDLPQALGIASRGAQAMNQSLTETVVAVGLVKNVIPGIERGSTAVATSMEKMVSSKTQKALREIGVSAVDATGNFRPFLDVIGDMLPALDKMTIADRGAFLVDTFGAHALAGVTAIMTQLTTGVKTNTGETLKNADAVAYLRKQTIYSEGTAADFSKRMLETYEGQKKLMNAKMDRAMIAIGAVFTTVLTPALRVVTSLLTGLALAVEAMPMPMKVFAAVVGLATLALVGIVGAAIALGAVMPLYKVGMAAMTTVTKPAMAAVWSLAGAVWTALAPFLLWIAVIAVVGLAILALTQNWWGITDAIVLGTKVMWNYITDFARGIWDAVAGAFTAIGDAAMSAFNWVADIVTGAFSWVRNILSGFGAWAWDWVKTLAMAYISPYIALYNIISSVVDYSIRLLTAIGKQVAASFMYWVDVVRNSDFWKWIVGAVETVRNFFVGLWEGAVEIFNFVMDTVKGMISDFVQSWVRGFQLVRDEVMWIVDIFWQGFTAIGDFIAGWAMRIGSVIWGAIMNFADMVSTGWGAITETLRAFGQAISDFFMPIFSIIGNWISAAVAWIASKVTWVSDLVTSIVSKISGIISKVSGWITSLPDWITKNAEATVAVTPAGDLATAAARAPAPSASNMPAIAQAQASQAQAGTTEIDTEGLAAALQKQPITTVVQVNGDTIFKAMSRSQRSLNSRAGRPVGVE